MLRAGGVGVPMNVLRKQREVAFHLDADCVEASGSHVGLIVTRANYRAIARAPATPELP